MRNARRDEAIEEQSHKQQDAINRERRPHQYMDGAQPPAQRDLRECEHVQRAGNQSSHDSHPGAQYEQVHKRDRRWYAVVERM